MVPPARRPPPLPDRKVEVDKLVGASTDYAASQDHVRPELARKQTFSGLGAMKPPPLPGELAPTLPSPPKPTLKETWNVPAPPLAVALARRTPIPPSDGPPVEETPPQSLQEGQEAALRKALAAERAKNEAAENRNAELERRERVRTETRSPGGWPPKVARSVSPVPSSAPAKVDQAIGAGLRHLLGKAAPFLLAAAGIGGGVTAVAKPSTDPAKTEAILSRLDDLGRKVDRVDAKTNGLLDREPQLTEFVECLYEQQADYFEQLLPSQQRLVTGSLQRTWVDRCRNRRPKR